MQANAVIKEYAMKILNNKTEVACNGRKVRDHPLQYLCPVLMTEPEDAPFIAPC